MRRFAFYLLLCIVEPHIIMAQGLGNIQNLFGINNNNQATRDAQLALKQNDVDKALVCYTNAVSQSQEQRNAGKGVSGDLLGEYAYALALNHDFEPALMNIDRARVVGTKYGDFYAAQVLTLMGHTKPAQQLMLKAQVPDWINGTYLELNEKYKTTAAINYDAPEEALKRANRLAATRQTIQSMVLFEELAAKYPQTEIIDIDYSTVWESLGNYTYAAELLQQGIEKMPEDNKNKQIFQNHLAKVNSQKARYENASWMKKLLGMDPLKMMTYIGGSVGKKMYSLNGRIGVYTSNKFSASVDLGMNYISKQFSGSIGASAYKTWGIFVCGLGFAERFSKSNNSFNFSTSAGLTFLNKSQTSSFDIMVNGYFPVTKGSNCSYSISIGKTIYFDINKLLK